MVLFTEIQNMKAQETIPVYQSTGKKKEDDFFTIKWLDLNIDSLERIEKPHRHDYFSIYFLIGGTTVQFIDFQEYRVKAKAIILMRPEQIHFHVKAQNAKLLQIQFKDQFLLTLQSKLNWQDLFSMDVVELNEGEMDSFLNFINLIHEEYRGKMASKEILSKLFSALLDKISLHIRQRDSQEMRKYNFIYKSFTNLVKKHALEDVKVSDYARKLFISAGHLNDVIKEITGKNAKTLINEQRILEAKRLLYWTDTPIREVAFKTGFEDPAYFTRFFKKYTGILPREFQRKE